VFIRGVLCVENLKSVKAVSSLNFSHLLWVIHNTLRITDDPEEIQAESYLGSLLVIHYKVLDYK
jgi:hypothetical protein